MVTVTIEREGYMVEAEVGGIDTGPGIAPGLEVREITKTWIHDIDAFAAEHDKFPAETRLDDVVAAEMAEINDELIDAAQSEIENDDSGFDPYDDVESDYAELW